MRFDNGYILPDPLNIVQCKTISVMAESCLGNAARGRELSHSFCKMLKGERANAASPPPNLSPPLVPVAYLPPFTKILWGQLIPSLPHQVT